MYKQNMYKYIQTCNYNKNDRTGAINALILNPVAAVKYTTWNSSTNRTYTNQLWSMYQRGGSQQFMKGMYATMSRDILFGSTFAYLRHSRRRRWTEVYGLEMTYPRWLWIDASSAFVATMLSSPFNYVRNIQYATLHGESKSMRFILTRFYRESLREKTTLNMIKYWLFRLRIGWGTARVAVGMSITSACYEMTQKWLA